MLTRLAAPIITLALFTAAGCEGSAGVQGPPGPPGSVGNPGTSCTAVDNGDGTITISCEDGTTVTVTDGADGQSCTIVDNGDGTKTITCADGTTVTVSDGSDGPPGEGYFPLDVDGVVGLVKDRAGEIVAGGTVYFVPAADVAALAATTIAVDSDNDEPLEDLIRLNVATYQSATVGANGRYTLDTVAAGSYFVTFVPAAGDDMHLPGGSACRSARANTDLAGTRLDLEVSSVPPADATFIGSGRCMSCHGLAHITSTMHRIGIWSPYENGLLQNLAPRYADLYDALDGKFTAAGTTIWYYDYDATRGFDKYKTSETDPGAGVAFTVTLYEEGGRYKMLLHNVQNLADPDRVIEVDAVYGGGVKKQRYLTKVTTAFGFYYATMPPQFHHDGAEGSPYGRTSKTWRDYHGDWWYNEATDTFRTPAAAKSFEKNCASCHAANAQLTGSDATTWTMNVISDPLWGDFDYNTDGLPDEVNVGCETCHGPGSEHWAEAGQGKAIVSPSLLTPEREAMICGQCHSRPKGFLGTDSPVNDEGWMMRAGTSREQFLTEYATTQLDGAASDFYGDAAQHSKSHHQQYSDFIRSAMYKNDRELMTCSACHDPHDGSNPNQLRADPTDENALCGGSCHGTQTADKAGHITAKLGAGMGGLMGNAQCTQCHMPDTAKTGAGEPGILVGATQYWQGDISSHLFDVPRMGDSSSLGMPTGYTESCGQGCHDFVP